MLAPWNVGVPLAPGDYKGMLRKNFVTFPLVQSVGDCGRATGHRQVEPQRWWTIPPRSHDQNTPDTTTKLTKTPGIAVKKALGQNTPNNIPVVPTKQKNSPPKHAVLNHDGGDDADISGGHTKTLTKTKTSLFPFPFPFPSALLRLAEPFDPPANSS